MKTHALPDDDHPTRNGSWTACGHPGWASVDHRPECLAQKARDERRQADVES